MTFARILNYMNIIKYLQIFITILSPEYFYINNVIMYKSVKRVAIKSLKVSIIFSIKAIIVFVLTFFLSISHVAICCILFSHKIDQKVQLG